MMDRQGGKLIFECDNCNEVLETGTGEWTEAKAKLDREGWRAYQIGSIWNHSCPKHARGR